MALRIPPRHWEGPAWSIPWLPLWLPVLPLSPMFTAIQPNWTSCYSLDVPGLCLPRGLLCCFLSPEAFSHWCLCASLSSHSGLCLNATFCRVLPSLSLSVLLLCFILLHSTYYLTYTFIHLRFLFFKDFIYLFLEKG